MQTDIPSLPLGYVSVPSGHIATVVTCLEMTSPPDRTSPPASTSLSLEHMSQPHIADYRELFRLVGADWMWVSRLTMADEKLLAILKDSRVAVYILKDAGRAIGMLELDFREQDECELSYFGLVKDAIGKGAGRFMMAHALEKAWARPIKRFWVHTCHLDSPAALPFYRRSGFVPFKMQVETMVDPRLFGLCPRTASPHVPLIER